MKVLVIGAVAAGLTAAYSIRKNIPEAKITIYEKGNDISYGACGFPYYIEGLIEEERKLIAKTSERVKEDGLHLLLAHEVVDVDFDKKELTVKNHKTQEIFVDAYDELVLGVGASALRLPAFQKMKGVFALNNLADANAIKNYIEEMKPQKAVIVGGGNKGIELLETLTLLAIDTQVIEFMPHILSIYDEDVSSLLVRELRGEGHKINTGEKVLDAKANEKGFVEKVITDQGTYEADLVLETIGLRPNTAFLEGKGLDMERGAIKTTLYGETNLPHVYAAGDCALIYDHLMEKPVYLPLGTNANKVGKLIGLVLAGKKPPFKGVQGSALLKVFEFEMAMTGITDKGAKALGKDYDSVLVRTRNKSGYYPGGSEFFVKLTYEKLTGKVLGAQVFGKEGAGLRIQGLVASVYAGLTIEDLAYMDFGYIPPLNSVWDSINVAAGKAVAQNTLSTEDI